MADIIEKEKDTIKDDLLVDNEKKDADAGTNEDTVEITDAVGATDDAKEITPNEDKQEKETTKVDEPDKSLEDNPKETKDETEVVNVDDLLKDVDDKGKQVETLTAEYIKEQGKVETLTNHVTELEAVVSKLIETKLAGIPEEYHDLMPEGNSIKKLEWIAKAEEKGLIPKKKSNPNIEIGKPLKTNDTKGSNAKPEKVSTQQKLSNFFSAQYTK